ncbi:MAG: F0F1 ATP synthase subunit alpha, partial [Pseudogulbenkiania sp.]|nr:F0F1 ATP synthase subunit alpha [Pseudogulbenkiania sp.]
AAQTKVIKKLGGGIRLALAQYRELAAFSQFASDLDEATRKQLQHGEIVTELMKQKQFATLSTAEMALTLWAVNKGYYEDVPVKKALAFEAAFLAYVRANHADVLKTTDASGNLTDDHEKVLAKAIESFKAGYSFN